MPLNIDITQILLHLLNFVILAGVLSLLVYKPAAKFLAARRERLAAEIEKNEAAARENETLREEYEKCVREAEAEAVKIRSNAEKEAAEIASATINAANEKAAQIIAAAEKEAEDRKKLMLSSVQTEIEELVVASAQKLLCDTASEERSGELYDAFIRTLRDKRG